MGKCIAYACLCNSKKKEDGVSFHRFPSDINMRRKWFQNLGLKNWDSLSYARVCSKHFETKYFYKTNSKTKLMNQAVPTLHLQLSNHLQEMKVEKTESVEVDTLPSTSEINLDKLSRDANNSEEMYSLSDSERNFMKRKMEAISFIQSLKSESDNESISFKTNVLSNDDEQLEFLTIIDEDDDFSESSKHEEKPNNKRSSSPSPDKNVKILENLDDQPSSPEFDDCSSLSISSMSEFEEELNETTLSSKFKRTNRPRFFGDCSFDDMKNPIKAQTAWLLAKKTIADLKLKNKRLHRRNQRLSLKIQAMRSLFRYLDENNFLNEYADAAVNAVILEKPASTPSA